MAQTSSERIRAWQGPAIFSFGFRPFFLFGALWVVAAMVLWLASLTGLTTLPTRFDPVSWHAHEFLFGYLGAVMAGFLLTAVPNWTGRLPLVGWPLAGLFALWMAGRAAVLFSAHMPFVVAVIVDLAFPIVLGAMILQEIVAGKNWRNLVVLALLGVFTLANNLFHIEAMQGGYAAQGVGLRLGVATAVMMITVIGGRIIPSFTRNWLARNDIAARPAPPMQRFDKLVLLGSLPVLGGWVLYPVGTLTSIALLAFSLAHFARLGRWQGYRTLSDPLVWVLHAAYAFIPLGGFALGLDQLRGNPGTAGAQHLWTLGAIGAMTLAVMTRATLGHTGQTLAANRATVLIYVCLFASAFARLCTPLWLEASYLAGFLWIAAFAGFVGAYGPSLLFAAPGKKK
ncbi:NnrS family protein [Sulfitobacter sp. M57]|uniref:NnrS family protein n=1 Tax=unclassified Sulfitobacter TaxID=196795 RepID=UPI0023E0C241|nr:MULTISPECIES: NnrS family protein [unclassified Sulfitobacter]MDF3416630.1 NnrS family protein [Sulfitobacter sp. KE5]MDF3424110.1 NnrS family protein [Sulfitobacter sp. KE43]MDF3435175.1 NnrS family protein [Sulfitobacter sp. KE42]MDF3460821.1 NnrS family protein [Sulfitobacter sp. S74]MDF3464712.1 NnrS family protein [Sulfitobacter sp. Ks18]